MSPAASLGLPEITPTTRDIISTLLRGGPLPRIELARRLSLSPASLTKLTRPLVDIGLFQQLEPLDVAGTGRPAVPLSIDPNWAHFLGVKLTADTAYAVLTDLSGTIVRHSERSIADRSVEDVLADIVSLVNLCAADVAVAGVGVTLAGSVIRDRGHVISSAFLGWSDVALAARIEQLLKIPVVVENDLRALTIARRWFDLSLTSFALVTFGAGIGCGLVLDDRLVQGHSGASGLIDHLRVDDHGPTCTRGHRGCASGYATTASILQSVRAASTLSPTDLGEVGDLARSGHPVATKVLWETGYAVGILVGTICNITGPQQVILSGEGVDLIDILQDAVERGLADVAHPALPPVSVTITPLSFTDWACGAAIVAIQQHLDLRSGLAVA